MKKTKHQRHTLSLSQLVYGDMTLNRDVELLQGVVRKGRPFVVSGVRRMHEPVSLGRTVILPKTQPTLPEPAPNRIEVSFDDDEPEEYTNQYGGLIADNEFVIDQDEIDAVRSQKDALESPIRAAMKEMTALLFATDDAANFVEAAMRDGLGYEVERDASLDEALVPITRLSVLTSVIQNLASLTDSTKNLLIHKLTSKTADEIIVSFNRRKMPDALAAMRKQYAATIKNAGVPIDLPDDGSALGVRASRR